MSTAAQAMGDIQKSIDTRRDQFIDRLLQSASGAFDIFTVYIGDKLGLYRALTEQGATTSAELASRTGTHERYIREWLEQQTIAGIVAVENAEVDAGARRFYLPAGHDEVLVDTESLNHVAPLAQLFVGAVSPLPDLIKAYRSGDGVPYAAYGEDLREGQARINRALCLYELGQEWLPSIADLHQRLQSPTARVADIGCGYGWSSIGIAQGYSNARVDGYDLDKPSVDAANQHVANYSLSHRVQIHHRDAGDTNLAGHYDLVIALECLHDMARPVQALKTMRRLAGDDGTVLVVDERVGEQFTAKGNDVEWMMYGWSVLHCLPVGLAEHQPSAATGTVMRPDTVRQYATEAGFSTVEILPIDNFFFRVYRLHQ